MFYIFSQSLKYSSFQVFNYLCNQTLLLILVEAIELKEVVLVVGGRDKHQQHGRRREEMTRGNKN